MFSALEHRACDEGQPLDGSYLEDAARDAPRFEARYKLGTRLIVQSGIRNVLEIAAGHSPRGLQMTEDPTVTYVETDLSGIIAQKQAAVRTVGVTRSNLFIEQANALNGDDLVHAARHFTHGPIAVINEGLLSYLTFEEKENMARTVHRLLKQFGGMWVTPDIPLAEHMRNERVGRSITHDSARIGRNLETNRFVSEDAAREFFEQLGFSIERHTLREVERDLVSLKGTNVPPEDIAASLNRPVFVMRAGGELAEEDEQIPVSGRETDIMERPEITLP
ncbi:MAG: class I SAM-dependent methyltransferase [Xanthobacteraceae bacterium]